MEDDLNSLVLSRNLSKKVYVIVFELNNREALEISTFMKNKCEIYDRQDTIDCEDYSTNCLEFITKKFKLIEPVLKMVEAGLIVKVIYYFRNNFYYSDNVKEELKQILEYNRIECEIISDQGSLCFLLQKSDENFKIIHLFSSEKQRAPDSTLSKEIKGSIKYINYHYTGSSLECYGSTINRVINKLMKEVDGQILKRSSTEVDLNKYNEESKNAYEFVGNEIDRK